MSLDFAMISNGPANRGSSLLFGPLLKLDPCSHRTKDPMSRSVVTLGDLLRLFSSISDSDCTAFSIKYFWDSLRRSSHSIRLEDSSSVVGSVVSISSAFGVHLRDRMIDGSISSE